MSYYSMPRCAISSTFIPNSSFSDFHVQPTRHLTFLPIILYFSFLHLNLYVYCYRHLTVYRLPFTVYGRANYTRSLAVMSMVGYVLGLGDRHPSNLMLDRKSGKVLHIDFGDCFEVAMQREKFPERVPFRLTRMLVSLSLSSSLNYISPSYKIKMILTVFYFFASLLLIFPA